MMTITELFYGPIEPTWIVHPGNKRQNGNPNNGNYEVNPYAIYSDDTHTYRRNPYMQRNAVPNTMLAQETTTCRPVQGMMYPYQTQYGSMAVPAGQHGVENQKQSPARLAVLQPRNNINVQTVHLMVPMCCDRCEEKVKEKLLDLDDVQRVTCDQWNQRVTVTSSVAPERLLQRVQKIKKRSTFWPQQQNNRSGHAQTQQNQKPNQENLNGNSFQQL